MATRRRRAPPRAARPVRAASPARRRRRGGARSLSRRRGVVGRVLSTVGGRGDRRGLLRRRCRAPLRLEFVHLGDRGQAPIALVSGQQFAMGAPGGDDAALEHGHLVGGGDRGRAVADHERGPVRRRAPQRGQQRRLGAGVEVAGDVVERQHPRLDQQRPRDRHALALAARQRDAGLAHLGVQAVVHGVQRPRELGRRCGRLHLGVAGVAAAVGDVVPDGPVDQEALAVGDRNGLPQGVQAHRAHVGAPELDAPAVDVVEPVDQRDHRRLPRAGRSDDRERAPIRHREIDVAEGRRRSRVGEADAAQEGRVTVAQRRRVGRVQDRGLRLEDLAHPVQGGQRGLGRGQPGPQGLGGWDEEREEGEERHPLAVADLVVEGQVPSVEHHREQAQRGEQRHQRRVARLHAVDPQRGRERRGAERLEARALGCLAREGADDAHAGDVLGRQAGDLGQALAGGDEHRADAPRVAQRADHRAQQRRQRDGGQPPVERKHDDGRAQDGQHGLADVGQREAEELRDAVELAAQPRHELPGLLAVEEGLVQGQQMGEHAPAQLGDHAHVDAGGDARGRHRHAGAEDGEERDAARDQVDPVLVAVLDRGHRGAGQQRRGDAVDHAEHRQDRQPVSARRVGPQEREQRRRTACPGRARRASARSRRRARRCPRSPARWP